MLRCEWVSFSKAGCCAVVDLAAYYRKNLQQTHLVQTISQLVSPLEADTQGHNIKLVSYSHNDYSRGSDIFWAFATTYLCHSLTYSCTYSSHNKLIGLENRCATGNITSRFYRLPGVQLFAHR